MDLGAVNVALTTVGKFINDVKKYTGYVTTSSLNDVAKLTRVEPLTIISKDLIYSENMFDINQTLLSLFSAYYLQAIAILTTVQDVRVVKLLDALNPNRDETGFLLNTRLSKENHNDLIATSYTHRLPGTSRLMLALEANNNVSKDKNVSKDIKIETVTNDSIDAVNMVNNLSVGKLLNVKIGINQIATDDTELTDVNNKTTIALPIAVRLIASVLANDSIVQLLTISKVDNSLVERYHSWRSGRISFIRDLIFCQDLIDEYKIAAIKDETNTIQEIMRRASNSKKYGLLTQNPSLVSASNLFVISETIARDIELKLGGKLTNPRVRETLFQNTYAMIIAVYDRSWERVSFYIRGSATAADFSIKEIKTANKNKSSIDIMDLFKSIASGSPVSF